MSIKSFWITAIATALFLSLVPNHPAAAAQEEICCACVSANGAPFNARQVAGFGHQVCAGACSSAFPGARWTGNATDAACNAPPPSVRQDVKWYIEHQGVSPWKNSGDGNSFASGDELRIAFRGAARGELRDYDAVQKASSAQLESAAMDGVRACVNETRDQYIIPYFEYASRGDDQNRGFHDDFADDLHSQNWQKIRNDFNHFIQQAKKGDNDKDKFINALACYNGSQLRDLVVNHSPAAKPPKPPPPPRPVNIQGQHGKP